jgi:MoaA/NifB/PqqE/SkfB family radical SAM enzyme
MEQLSAELAARNSDVRYSHEPAMGTASIRRSVRALTRRVREARMFAHSLKHPYHPVVAQIVPTRRCNLSCTYCNEYDQTSDPVPTEEMFRRIDRLAQLGTGIITLSGGEPLLHPHAEDLVARIRDRGAIATLITNGYLLTRARIARLNAAGLDSLQISIDNVTPDEVSKKSLKVLDQKLRWLAEEADFQVTVNAVLGGGIRHPEDALVVARRARDLGFQSTVGIIHESGGRIRPLSAREQAILREVSALNRPLFSFDRYNRFQETLARGEPCEWHCRAGSRYLYICEDGLVHYCSQQRGFPGIPLTDYTVEDLRREGDSVKSCAPYCTIGCVHRVAMIDDLRENPTGTLESWFASPGSTSDVPLPVRALLHIFVTGPTRTVARRAVGRLLE